MPPDTDDAAVQADAYIDALLAAHRHALVALSSDAGLSQAAPLATQPAVRDLIRLLEAGLPRFHPSFVFEEWLSERLRESAQHLARATGQRGEVIPIAFIPMPRAASRRLHDARLRDRRVLVGGAIASGVSIGAAVFAWRRARN